MRQIFSLIRKEWNENFRIFISVPISVFLCASLIMFTNVYLDGISNEFYATHFFVAYGGTLLFMGFIWAYFAFRFTEKQNQTIAEITLPATVFQKWIAKVLTYYVFPLIVCIVIFTLLQIISISIIATNKNIEIIPLSRLPERWIMIFILFISYSLVQSFFFVGMLHFKRVAFFKTFVAFFITLILFFWGIYKLSEVFFGVGTCLFLENELSYYKDYQNFSYKFYYESAPVIIWLKIIAYYIGIPILLFVASYFKFKERELR